MNNEQDILRRAQQGEHTECIKDLHRTAAAQKMRRASRGLYPV